MGRPSAVDGAPEQRHRCVVHKHWGGTELPVGCLWVVGIEYILGARQRIVRLSLCGPDTPTLTQTDSQSVCVYVNAPFGLGDADVRCT